MAQKTIWLADTGMDTGVPVGSRYERMYFRVMTAAGGDKVFYSTREAYVFAFKSSKSTAFLVPGVQSGNGMRWLRRCAVEQSLDVSDEPAQQSVA